MFIRLLFDSTPQLLKIMSSLSLSSKSSMILQETSILLLVLDPRAYKEDLYGTPIDRESLKKIELVEDFIRKIRIRACFNL
jgi:hypothetical protein